MQIYVPKELKKLAQALPKPLYVVGGYVRNFLINGTPCRDIDVAAALPAEEVAAAALTCGMKVKAEYKRTGTVVLCYGGQTYEYTRFRVDRYAAGGKHRPTDTAFTDDVKTDALRRDFKCNAVYYDIVNETIVDPLDGVKDVENGIIDTVKDAESVFCSDGLRLMRLARFAAELNFKPSERAVTGAKKYADNVKDVAPERIYEELKRIIESDEKYPFSDKKGHYTGFKILENTGVLDRIFPEITAGRGMSQRMDFHKYDVLEHSLRTLLYAKKEVRLAAFLHDVAKPYCKSVYGTYRGHAEAGETIAKNVLNRLRVDKRTVKEICFLVRWHMLDLDCTESEETVRKFIAENEKTLPALLDLKQADYSAGKDDFSVCPTVKRWRALYEKMKSDGTPFSLKELKISASELSDIGFSGAEIGEELSALFDVAVKKPVFNENSYLKECAVNDFGRLLRET